MKKFALIAILVVIAVVLVTCDLLVPEAIEEWTDVEYEIEGVVGRERVKSIKLYLQPDGLERSVLPGPDTYGVRVSPEQKRIIRALSADTAAASHDFFEAVFVNGGTATNPNYVVRTTWEIGYPAGVSGGLLPNADYGALTASTVFVGRKANKTLLGVGKMTHVDDTISANGTKTVNTYSVTFTVAPLRTWLGYYDTTPTADNPTWAIRQRATFYGAPATGTGVHPDSAGSNRTFVTNQNATPTPPATPYGTGRAFTPIPGRGSVYYPLFTRPIVDVATTMTGIYTIGGIVGAPAPIDGDLLEAIRVFGTLGGTPTPTQNDAWNGIYVTANGGMQVIKRKPAYLYQGRTYQAGSIYDSFTGVTLASTYSQAHGDAFDNSIDMEFSVTPQSSGIFAITFQCPVYAITTKHACQNNVLDGTNLASRNKFVKWFIRPADGQDLYLLDSGADEGGMVMLGDMDSLTDDWIEIKTLGIGFQNN